MSYAFAASPLLQPLLGHDAVAQLFSVETDLREMLRFEVELARAQAVAGVIPADAVGHVSDACARIEIAPASFAAEVARDGMVVPELVRRLKTVIPEESRAHVHFQSTSQDVIDTSLMLRARPAVHLVIGELDAALRQLQALKDSHGGRSLIARTRMQRALPVTAADRLALWESNLRAAVSGLASLAFPLQASGAVGTLKPSYGPGLAQALGLTWLGHSWQAERSPVLALGNACSGVAIAGGKVGIDVGLMAQNEFAEIKLTGGGSSSAMHHKQNPVKAEVLVSLARFSAALLSGLHNAAIHEQERSGAAWTLEWLILPQMICAAAGSARVCRELLESVESIAA